MFISIPDIATTEQEDYAKSRRDTTCHGNNSVCGNSNFNNSSISVGGTHHNDVDGNKIINYYILNGLCSHDICQNGGTCVPIKKSPNFTCLCQKGFKGIICESQSGEISSIIWLKKFAHHTLLNFETIFRAIHFVARDTKFV